MSDNHRHKFVGGVCIKCGEDEIFSLTESEVNDEEITRYKRFGIG